MKKPLIKALGVILSAAMICGSVPAGVSPALAAEVTEGVSPAPVMEVSAEAAATNEVSVIDTGNEEKESDNSSTDPDEDATSVSGNAAEDETGEAASDDETEEVDGSDNYFAGKDLDIFALDYKSADADTINDYLRSVPDATIAAWISGLSKSDKEVLMEKGTNLNETLDYYGEDIDAIGLTDGQHFETAMDYYELLATGKNVYAYFWGSKKGSITVEFIINGEKKSSQINIAGIDTTKRLRERQKTLSYTVNNSEYGLTAGDSAYTWMFGSDDNDAKQALTKIDGGNNKYMHTYMNLAFTKPAGYALSDINYSGNTTGRFRLYNNCNTSYGKGVGVIGNSLGTDYNYGTATNISARLVSQVCNFGINEMKEGQTQPTTTGHNGVITFTLSPATYHVAYDSNGGSGVDSQTCTYGTTYTYAAAPKTAPHYTLNVNLNGAPGTASAISAPRAFLNWGNVAAGQQFSNLTTTNGATITKVANWGNGTCTLPAAPSRTGYYFGGWQTAQGVKGAGTAYAATKNETITAVWGAQKYTVNFVSDGKNYGSQSFVYGTAQGLRSLADLKISKPGYTFKGWNGTYTDGQAVKDLTDINNGTVTLTAQWEAKTDTPYTVHRYVQKSVDNADPATGYELYKAPEGTENLILGTETKTATTDTSVTEIAVAIPGYDTPDAIGPKTIAGDGSTTFDFYYNITDTRATLTVNHYYQTEIDGDWVLYDGTFGSITDTTFTNVFHGTIGESVTPEQLSADAIKNYKYAYNYEYTLVPTESPKTVVLTKNSEVNYYYKMVKKNTVVKYKVDHYIQKTPGGNYELFETTIDKAELGSTISPALNQNAIDAVNAIEGCKCEKPQLQVVTITQEGMVFKYNYACVKGTPDVISGGSNLSDETINEIAKKLAAGLSFSMDIDGVTYEIVQNPDGTLAIKFAATTDTKVVIPDVIKIGDKIYRITEVNEKAFKDNTTIREVVISQNVSKIGNSAFEGCTSLEKVTLKEGLVTIGDKAFKGCSSLTSITMPATVQKIGNYAFENCTKLKTVKLNEGLLTIGKKAFYNCKALKKVKIPKSVLKIGSFAFAKCAALTSFTFATDSQLMSMGTGVLSNDKKLTKIKLPGKLTAVPSKAFKNDTKLASVTIGKSVTRIGAEAFNGCKKIKKVTIPTKVQTIGEKAFYNCKSLKTVSIKSKALTSVGEKAFKKCKKGLKLVVPGKKTAAYKKLLNGKY